MLTHIKDLGTKLAPTLIEIRRHIHAHPELSGQEHQTAAYVAGVLSSYCLFDMEAVINPPNRFYMGACFVNASILWGR